MQVPRVRQLRVQGGGAEDSPAPQGSPEPSAQRSPPSSEKVQSSLSKFFGSTPEQQLSQPTPPSFTKNITKRQRLSRFAEDALREREEHLRRIAELEAEKAETNEALEEVARLNKLKSNKRKTGRPRKPEEDVARGRKRPGTQTERLEVTAATKYKYCCEMELAQKEFVDKKDFWKAMVRRYGLTKQQLMSMLSKKEHWFQLSKQQPKLKGLRKQEKTSRKRAFGAGRKVPFSDIIAGMRQWLSVERACGHSIAKADLAAEYLARLQLSAEKLKEEAEHSKALTPLQKGELLHEASERLQRKSKLLEKPGYKKSFVRKLIDWLGAKYVSAELVTNISETESKTRCLLTWQEFDKTLWLATCAAAETLKASDRVASPEDFVSARPHLVIGFSDQIPLWAKATGRKAIFAEEEIQKPEHIKDFSEVRQAILDIMHSDDPAEMVVQPLEKKQSFESATPPTKRQLSFPSSNPSPPSSIVRKLSFGEAAGSSEQVVPATPEEQPEPDNSSQRAVAPAIPDKEASATTIIGVSGDERFRITYEARQLLHSVHSQDEIVGSVCKGLLVVPGQWARLSNISEGGTWLKTESFQVGDKTVVRKQGTSVGRILEPYRKLRKSHPELMSKLEVMSQPASNVDSVILTWSIQAQAEQYPCSMWMRDCFSSVFTDSAAEAMALANQLSCLVAEKCTSKLQITDTDFSKQFKALVRSKLTEMRSEWQTQIRDSHSVWKVGPKEIVTAVVHAQEFLRKLEELLSQKWAQELKLEMGTKRYKPEYLSDRLKWLNSEGVQVDADWNLSEVAKSITDLQVWDYFHPEDEDETGELQITDALNEDLELELQNSLSLRLSPALRRAGLRRLGTKQYKEAKLSEKKNPKHRAGRAKLRKAHRSKLVKGLALKVQSQSRREALAEIKPAEAQQKKKKAQKPSLVLKAALKMKASAKTKPSLHSKPSAVAKAEKKIALKAKADKELRAAEKIAAEEAPPLPPPAEGPPASEEDSLLHTDVVVISEAAGKTSFGKVGNLMSFSSSSGAYTLLSDTGAYQVMPEWLEPKDSKPAVKPVQWPKWSQLSKKDTKLILTQLSSNPEDQSSLQFDEWSYHTVLPCPQDVAEVEDQHLWLGWVLLRWMLSKSNLPSCEELGINCVDPILSKLLNDQDDPYQLAALEAGVQSCWLESTKVLLVPIYASFHWTLLVAKREGPQHPIAWTRYDSLSQEHAESHPVQLRMGKLLDPQFELPPLKNVAKQPIGSNACRLESMEGKAQQSLWQASLRG
ncbi:unnamed protein product [Durusdinium trenchii]|uniref:Ubiquitin-like protease family profile domain-containing protein n=1 Tax=Durusdinium trenchii TaxID=1381693 RepID=A0ABP0JBJ7_9DINO